MSGDPRTSAAQEHDSLANYVNEFHAGLDRLIRKQFWSGVALVTVVVVFVLVGTGVLLWFFQEAPHPEAFSQIRDANAQLTRTSQELAQAMSETISPTVSTALVNAIVRQSEAHQSALNEVERAVEGISQEGLNWLQLLGGSVIVILIGYLGLLRLQNIDAEIQNLREFMFKQIKERMEEGREVLVSTVDSEVDNRFAATRNEITRIQTNFQQSIDQSRSAFSDAATEATQRLEAIESGVRQLFDRYSWLQEPGNRTLLEEVAALNSVEEAHDLASKLHREGDRQTAKLALDKITQDSLKGSADDFHNAHTEAMRLKVPTLALEIAEAGLKHFPDQYDLMADKARALISVGRATEAIAFVDEWRTRQPEEFARGWRPFVFYLDAVCSGQLTTENMTRLDEAFAQVVLRTPYEDKIWSSYARYKRDLGDMENAEAVCRNGLNKLPNSQEINYVLGTMLLRIGRAAEAVEYLEKAMNTDYQEHFQFDVNQESLLASLGQAYEANGKLDRAAICYKRVIETPSEISHVKFYALGRLRVLQTREALNES